jgi:hypothetical protein
MHGPDGKHYFYFQFLPSGQEGSIHLASLDSQQDTALVNSEYRAQYANGRLVRCAHTFSTTPQECHTHCWRKKK